MTRGASNIRLFFRFQLDRETEREFIALLFQSRIRYRHVYTNLIPAPDAFVTLFFAKYAELIATIGLLYKVLENKEKPFKVKFAKPDGTNIETDDPELLKELASKESERRSRPTRKLKRRAFSTPRRNCDVH